MIRWQLQGCRVVSAVAGYSSAYRAYVGECRDPADAGRRHNGAAEFFNRDTRTVLAPQHEAVADRPGVARRVREHEARVRRHRPEAADALAVGLGQRDP